MSYVTLLLLVNNKLKCFSDVILFLCLLLWTKKEITHEFSTGERLWDDKDVPYSTLSCGFTARITRIIC